jgi:hypothetical protein
MSTSQSDVSFSECSLRQQYLFLDALSGSSTFVSFQSCCDGWKREGRESGLVAKLASRFGPCIVHGQNLALHARLERHVQRRRLWHRSQEQGES